MTKSIHCQHNTTYYINIVYIYKIQTLVSCMQEHDSPVSPFSIFLIASMLFYSRQLTSRTRIGYCLPFVIFLLQQQQQLYSIQRLFSQECTCNLSIPTLRNSDIWYSNNMAYAILEHISL